MMQPYEKPKAVIALEAVMMGMTVEIDGNQFYKAICDGINPTYIALGKVDPELHKPVGFHPIYTFTAPGEVTLQQFLEVAGKLSDQYVGILRNRIQLMSYQGMGLRWK